MSRLSEVAKRGREGIAKRARERARQQRQEEKRQRHHAAAAADPAIGPDESALMEEFRVLSERHAAGLVPEDLYSEDRQRIFEQLGIESHSTD
jgi:hypothetical protein